MAEYEQALPIDIHYNKLLGLFHISILRITIPSAASDWLIDRRHCDSKWLAQIRPIRERVQANFPHLPPDVLASFSDQQRESSVAMMTGLSCVRLHSPL